MLANLYPLDRALNVKGRHMVGFADDFMVLTRSWAGSDIISRQLEIQPTITVRPGFRLNILVNKDMILQEPHR